MCTSLSIAELPPLTLCTVQLDSFQGQDNVLLMSNNVSELAIIRKGILKELFLPRSAFLRGRNSVLGFCAWTIRISCYRSRERATEHIIRDILALNIFCSSKGEIRNILRVAALWQLALYICSSCGSVLLNGGSWWCREPEYSGYLAPAGQPWPGQASAVLATPGFGIPKIFEANHVKICISNLWPSIILTITNLIKINF